MKSVINNPKMQIIVHTIIYILCALFVSQEAFSQVVEGRLVDENGDGLAEVNLELYISSNLFATTSESDGSFTFTGVNSVEDDQLPTGYHISNNFPNPFNPTTRIMITLPVDGNVNVEVYNLLGETVTNRIEKHFNAGMNHIDLELDGLPNGLYITRITLDDKYTVIKKMMLLYGSQHLSVTGSLNKLQSNKQNGSLLVDIDSLVALSSIIGRTTFTNLPPFIGGTLSLGNLTVTRYCTGIPTVNYEGKTYHTVKIGEQCWLKENLDVGIMINGIDTMQNNAVIEKYCYDDDPSNCVTYGGLYQWDEAMQYSTIEGVQGICPPGWHIPTLAEFETLKNTVGEDGNSLKAIGTGCCGAEGTNTSGFSALFAGECFNGNFTALGFVDFFRSSTEHSSWGAYGVWLYYSSGSISLNNHSKTNGHSVRCIKD